MFYRTSPHPRHYKQNKVSLLHTLVSSPEILVLLRVLATPSDLRNLELEGVAS